MNTNTRQGDDNMQGAALKPNPDCIRDFIGYITRPWAGLGGNPMIEIRAISPTRQVNVARFALDWMDDAVQHVQAMNAAKQNVYMVINPVDGAAKIDINKGAKDSDIMAAFFMFADADSDNSMRNILAFAGPKFTMSVKTGATPYMRGHAYWELEEPCANLDAWRSVQRSIAASLGTDPVVINPSRIMRIAGTVSWPGEDKRARGYVEEYVTMRTEFSTDRDPVPFERMMRAFPPVAAMTSTLGADQYIDTGKQAMDRAMAEAAINSGTNWHENIIRLVASYVAKGLSDSEIHALTDRFTQPPYTADDTRREVQQAIDGARAKGWTPETQMSPQQALQTHIQTEAPADAQPAQAEPKQRKPIFWAADAKPVLDASYMVKGWLGQRQMSVVYGPSNVGKSFFCLDLAYCIAANIPWQGYKVNGGAVLYLATEGGNAFRNRVYALQQAYAGVNVPLAIRPSPVNLLQPEADMPELGALCKEIEQTHGKIALIVIDTLSRAMAGGNENGPEDMTAFIANVDALRDYTGAHTLVVHHTGKDAAQGARGHSSLRAATDTEIELEVNDSIRTATATKQRDLEPAKPMAFRLKVHELGNDPDDDAVTTCTIEVASHEDMEEAKQKRPRGRNQVALIEAFNQMRADGIGEKNPGGTGWPEIYKYWIIDAKDFEEFAKGKIAGANPRSAFKQAYEALIGAGYMAQNNGYVWISAKEGRS
jgi:hypothetical protein